MDGIRTYQTDDLIVYWDAKQCSHSAKCWHNLPQVFKPSERPWITIDKATPEEIIHTIDLCPTGALKYELTQNSRVDPAIAHGPGSVHYSRGASTEAVEIKTVQGGPLLVKGLVRIVDSNGEVIKEANRMTLCACGKSANKPFCDGSHMRQK